MNNTSAIFVKWIKDIEDEAEKSLYCVDNDDFTVTEIGYHVNKILGMCKAILTTINFADDNNEEPDSKPPPNILKLSNEEIENIVQSALEKIDSCFAKGGTQFKVNDTVI